MTIEFVTDRPGHDFRYAINNSKINKKLNGLQVQIFRKTIKYNTILYRNGKK